LIRICIADFEYKLLHLYDHVSGSVHFVVLARNLLYVEVYETTRRITKKPNISKGTHHVECDPVSPPILKFMKITGDQ